MINTYTFLWTNLQFTRSTEQRYTRKQSWNHVISKRMKRSIKEKFNKPRYNLLARPFESFVKSGIATIYLEDEIQQLVCIDSRALFASVPPYGGFTL